MSAWAVFYGDEIIHWTIRPTQEGALDEFFRQRGMQDHAEQKPFSWWRDQSNRDGLSVRHIHISDGKAEKS